MSSDLDSIIEIDELEKAYGDFRLYIPRLSIKKGEVIGLIGANGAGKTTLIELILHLVRQDRGSIRIFGTSSFDHSIKKNIAAVSAQCYFSNFLSIREINSILKAIYKNKWNQNQFLSNVLAQHLPLNKIIGTFSTGMRAKLNILSALGYGPKLLILDEATSNLDPIARKEFTHIISSYAHSKDCTIVFSSHLVNELSNFCDRVIFIDEGNIILDAPLKELNENFYIVRVHQESEVPKNTIAVFDEGKQLLCLAKNIPKHLRTQRITSGVQLNDLMFLLKKGRLTK